MASINPIAFLMAIFVKEPGEPEQRPKSPKPKYGDDDLRTGSSAKDMSYAKTT